MASLEGTFKQRGSNLVAVRAYNERLVIQIIRVRGAMPKAEIARATGLTAQTISTIVSDLEGAGMLIRGKPVRGKVGQPSIPFTLNPMGGVSIGLHIGRRSAEMVLCDLTGSILAEVGEVYEYPEPQQILDFAQRVIRNFSKRKAFKDSRLVGVGVCEPSGLAAWQAKLGAPAAVVAQWQDMDAFHQQLDNVLGAPAVYCNDASAACAAELVFGSSADLPNHLYLFAGSFIGGGLVLGGNLREGAKGNAAAVASIPIPNTSGEQLVDKTSLVSLEDDLANTGLARTTLWKNPAAWVQCSELVERWVVRAAPWLAHAGLTAHALMELDGVVIDGAFPDWVRDNLCRRVAVELDQMNQEGLSSLPVISGTMGSKARVLGGAAMPLWVNFAPSSNALIKKMV